MEDEEMEMGAITAEWRTHRIYSEYWIEETQIGR